MVNSNKDTGMVMKISSVTVLVVLTFLIIDGAFSQLQMALFSGIVPIPLVAMKTLLLAYLLLLFFRRLFFYKTIVFPKRIMTAWLCFMCYLCIDFLWLSQFYKPEYLIFGYNSLYFFIIVLPFTIQLALNARFVTNWFIALSIPLIIVGVLQFIINEPILPVESDDGYFAVLVYDFYGQVRAFSLFSTGVNYGHYLSYIGAILVNCFYQSKGISRWGIGISVFAVIFAIYTTLTRAIYLEFVFAVLTVLFVRMSLHSKLIAKIIKFTPLLYGLLAVGVSISGVIISSYSDLFSNDSLLLRHVEWGYFYSVIIKNGIISMLCGAGIVQHTQFEPFTENIIDNTFLGIWVNIGMIGLLLFVWLMWQTWKIMLIAYRCDPNNHVHAGVVALWSTWISTGCFNTVISIYFILAIISFMAKRERLPEFNENYHNNFNNVCLEVSSSR